MFRGLMNLSYRRTTRQAFGWYLTFWLIAVVLGAFVSAIVFGASIGFVTGSGSASVEEATQRVFLAGEVTAVMYHVVVGAALLWNRPKSAINILLVAGGVGLSPLVGALGGLIPLAVLTTRPSNSSPDVMKVFE